MTALYLTASPGSLTRLLWIKRNFVTLQKSFCSLHVSGARYNIGICVCRSFFYFKSGRKKWGLWVVLAVWEKRWLPLPLSIRVTMTGDGGENDFGFCSDAPLWRITLCCRLLAGPVSLACVTCTSRRVSHNNFVCACVCKCVCVPTREGGHANEGFVVHAPWAERARGAQRFDSGVDVRSEETCRTAQGQIKDDTQNTHFNYFIWLQQSSPGARQPTAQFRSSGYHQNVPCRVELTQLL